MPRKRYINWSALAITAAALGAGSPTLGGGPGTFDTGNPSGQPVFAIEADGSGNKRLINYYQSRNPGTYIFDIGSLCIFPDNAELFEDGQAVVKWALDGRMGVVLRAGLGSEKQSIACALVDGTFYIWAKNQAGNTFINYSQSTSVSIPTGAELRGSVLTSGTDVIVRVSISASGALDLSDPDSDPDTMFELDAYQRTIDCSARPELLKAGAAGVFEFNSGAAAEVASYVPSVNLTRGIVSLNKASHRCIRVNITPSTGGDGTATCQLYRNGTLLGTVTPGNYNDTTIEPYRLYTYHAVWTDGTGSVTSRDCLILSQPLECDVLLEIGDSNIGTFGDVPDSQKAPALFANWRIQGGRPTLSVNRAVAGTSTEDWATDVAGRLTAAIADLVLYGGGGRVTVRIHLGTNDLKDNATVSGPRSKADYKDNQLTIANAIWAAVPDAVIVYSVLPYIPDGTSEWSSAGQALQDDYLAAMQEIAAAHPGKVVVLNPGFLADSQTNAVAYGLVTGEVHLNAAGQSALFQSWQPNYPDVPYPETGGGTDVYALIQGPVRLSPVGCDGIITLQSGDNVPIRAHMLKANGDRLPVAGATLTAAIKGVNGATLVPSLEVSVITDDEGFINIQLDTSLEGFPTSGTCKLVITRTASPTNILVFKAPVEIS